MPKVPYPHEVNGKLVTENGSFIKPFLIAKFDCRSKAKFDESLEKALEYRGANYCELDESTQFASEV